MASEISKLESPSLGAEKLERLRAPIAYYGGKGQMLSKLLPLLPPGKIYVEPFCGAASMLFAQPPRPVEVLNDLDGDVVNMFRCFQDRATFDNLRHRIMWTPYARAEFVSARAILAAPRAVEDAAAPPNIARAWARFVCGNQGFAAKYSSAAHLGRAFIWAAGAAATANKWLMRLSMLDAWRWRLMRVQIDCVDALKCIRYWDSPETVFYLDPPYVLGTRVAGSRAMYAHEMDNAAHAALIDLLLGLRGRAMISCYDHPIYSPLIKARWRVYRWDTACSAVGRTRGSKLRGSGSALKHAPRTEVAYVKA